MNFPESIVVPAFDPNYDLVVLSAWQKLMLPYAVWWELILWTLFGMMLIWKGYHYLVRPYLTAVSS